MRCENVKVWYSSFVIIVLDVYYFDFRGTYCRVQFFFSSRRRHTSLQGDWSSDVCSSDLPQQKMCSIKSWGAAATKTGQYKKLGRCRNENRAERKSVVQGKSVDLGGRRIIKKKILITLSFVKWISSFYQFNDNYLL